MKRVLSFIGLAVCFALVNQIGDLRGYNRAKAEAVADNQYISDQMREAGFCRWVELTSFVDDCRRKSTISKVNP